MQHEDEARPMVGPRHHRAELLFTALAVGIAAMLALRLPHETVWIEGQPLSRQPALWPGIAIAGMLTFGAVELAGALRRLRRGGAPLGPELLAWIRAGEYALWFMAYVQAVPLAGYLPTTLAFCPLLALRLGYRRPATLLAAAATGAAVVVTFKAFLSVKVPGGAVYELLPPAIRNVMILYF